MSLIPLVTLAAALAAAAPATSPQPALAELATQVRAAEIAFAKTMADRDHAAFTSHVSDEALFFTGKGILRGRAAVADGWKRFFEGPKAPFSWTPETAEVIASGTLGITSGPVFDPDGKRIGTFNSIWRREADGSWRVLFDKGCPPCDCGGETKAPGQS